MALISTSILREMIPILLVFLLNKYLPLSLNTLIMKNLFFFFLCGLNFSYAYAQLPSYVPTNGLIGYWPFTDNAKDASGNGHNGVVDGAVLDNDRDGVANSSYSFNGISNVIKVPATGITNVKKTTVSAWIKYTGNANTIRSYDTYISFGDYNHSFGYSYDFQGQNFNLFQNCKLTILNTQNLFNQWNHVVVVQDSNITKVYLNNIRIDSVFNTNTNCYAGDNSLLFGAAPYDYQWMTGNLDDIGFWNIALNATEIASLFHGFSDGPNSLTQNKVFEFNPIISEKYISVQTENELLNETYYITDLTGKILNKNVIKETQFIIDISNFAAGIYFIGNKTNKFKTIKFIKK
jgi:Concanavalin A-like lectin/glucanases superfamily